MDTPSKAAPETGHKHPPSTREQRGLALFRERGHEIREVGEDTYRVPSTTGRGYYRADLAAGSCECRDHEHRGAFCLHLVAATVAEAKKNAGCRRQRTGRPAGTPGRRHGERQDDPRDDRRDAARPSDTPRRRGGSYGLDPARVRANLERMEG